MAGDLIREARRAVLTALKGSPGVTSIVPAASIHPSTIPPSPTWPFVRWGAPRSTPIDLTCTAGATVAFLLHGFAKDRYAAGALVETAEDHASRLGSALKLAVHKRRFPVGGGPTALVRVRSVTLLRDGDEEGAYHAALSCDARVLAA
jgi:hypothetical protein